MMRAAVLVANLVVVFATSNALSSFPALVPPVEDEDLLPPEVLAPEFTCPTQVRPALVTADGVELPPRVDFIPCEGSCSDKGIDCLGLDCETGFCQPVFAFACLLVHFKAFACTCFETQATP